MNPPDLDALIRRLVSAAFDAGVTVARRGGFVDKTREDQVTYATVILRAQVEAEATRLAKESA